MARKHNDYIPHGKFKLENLAVDFADTTKKTLVVLVLQRTNNREQITDLRPEILDRLH